MTEHPFHPDDIDKQIDQLSSSSQHRAVSTDERLLHDMQLLLNAGDINEQQQEDRASVQHVWTTITAKSIHTQTTHNNHRTTERFTIMSTPSSMPKRSTSWGRRLGLLSVAAIVVVLLGSAIVVFTSSQREGQVTHQPNTNTGAAPAGATPTPPPVGKQGTTVSTYQQPGYGIYGLQWSPDGKRIVSTNNGVYSWDAFNGANVIKYASLTVDRNAQAKGVKTPSLLFAQLSPDGKQLAVWNTTQIELYDVVTGKKLKTFTYNFSSDQQKHDQFSPYVGWSADGKSLKAIAQLTENGGALPSISQLVTYDVASGEKKQEVTLNVKGGLDRVHWSPNGKYVAAGLGSEGSVYVFDSETGKTVSKHFGSGPIETIELTWSPDSKQIAARFEDGIHIWNAINEKDTIIYQGGWNPVWSPNGKYIAAVDGTTTSVVRILDAATGKTLYTYKEHKGAVYDLAWSPDSVYIASGEGSVDTRGGGTGNTGTVRVWVARP